MEDLGQKIVMKDGVPHIFVLDGEGGWKCVRRAFPPNSRASVNGKRPAARARAISCPTSEIVEPASKRLRRSSGSHVDVQNAPSDEDDDDLDDVGDDDDDDEEEDDEAGKAAKTIDKAASNEATAKKGKRVTWKVPEVQKFLELCYEKHVVEKRDGQIGQNLTVKQIFEPVAKALNESKLGNMPKTSQDCSLKFTRLKKAYRRAMRQNKTSGQDRADTKYFDELHKLLHKRPNVNAFQWGFQSSSKASSSTSTESQSTASSAEEVTEDTSSQAPQAKPKIASKYRSLGGRASAASHIEAWRQQDAVEQERQRKWEAEQADEHRRWMAQFSAEQQEREERLMLQISESMGQTMGQVIAQTFASMGHLFGGGASQPTIPNFQQPQIQVPVHTPPWPQATLVRAPMQAQPRAPVQAQPRAPVQAQLRAPVQAQLRAPVQAQPRIPLPLNGIRHVRLIKFPPKSQ